MKNISDFCLHKEKRKQRMLQFIICLLTTLTGTTLFAQSGIGLYGGFSQAIFYSGQAKSEYMHSFTSQNAYLVGFTYKEDVSFLQKHMQLGAQLEFKQQSATFYYEDLFPTDTFATRVRYDIRSFNLYLFPELKVGEDIKFVFSGGPVLQYIVNTKALGTKYQIRTGQPQIETPIDDKNTNAISGLGFGLKLNLGLEIPLYKNLYLLFYNAYSFGLTGMKGTLREQMKYFNCLDVNISGGLLYRIEHKQTENF